MRLVKSQKVKKAIQFILRYKIVHIVFWVLRFSQLYHEGMVIYPAAGSQNLFDAVNIIFFSMLSVYTSVYFLKRLYIAKEKYAAFMLACIGCIAGSALLCTLSAVLYDYTGWGTIPFPSLTEIIIYFFGVSVNITLTTVGFVITILSYFYYQSDQKNKRMEKEKLESEISFLRAQINPHFLFNALNSIYALMKKDLKLSEQTLLKFSSLLRYQLYDCDRNETTLENEIEFVKNYISLEKVRTDYIAVIFTVPEKMSYQKIAPFIVMPFVENAFKHISRFRDKKNEIDVRINFSKAVFYLTVTNTYDDSFETDSEHQGIGLQNAKRRLELLYPGKHMLQISTDKNIYAVDLNINLNGI